MEIKQQTFDMIKEGQVWSYKNRNFEKGSRLIISKIDAIGKDIIIHIKIDGLKLRDKRSGEIIGTSIGHLPISLEMLKNSVCKVESIIVPSLDEGYFHWKELFDKGKAGVWLVEVADAIEMTEETYNSRIDSPPG